MASEEPEVAEPCAPAPNPAIASQLQPTPPGGRVAELLSFGVKARHARPVEYRVVMAGSIETLASEAMQLPPDQRLTLAHRLLSSVEPPASTEVDTAWDTEIRDRIARFDAGGVGSLPAAEVFAEVDRRLRR